MGYYFVAAAAALAVWAHRTSRDLDARALRRTLLVFAVSIALLRIALAVSLDHAPFAPLAALVGLVAWGAMARLVAFGARRGDLVFRSVSGALALVSAASGSVQAAVLFTQVAVMRYSWTSRFGTRTLFKLALCSLLVLPIVVWGVDEKPAGIIGFDAESYACARWTLLVAEWFVIVGVFALFRAFVRDPSLGIRTAGRRLALSHVLVAAVPLALVGAMWAFTTVLGVNNERAMVAIRVLEGEGRRWEGLLATRLAADGPWDAAATDTVTWPRDARVWVIREDSVRRVRGEPIPDEWRLTQWTDSLGSLPRSGMVLLDGTRWFGAAARSDSLGRAVVMLVPIRVLLDGDASRIVRARLSVPLDAVRDASGSVVFGPGAPPGTRTVDTARRVAGDSASAERQERSDSLQLERARGFTRRFGIPDSLVRAGQDRRRRVTFVGPRDTVDLSNGGSPGLGILLDGHALARGIGYASHRWTVSRAVVTASSPPGQVLAGLYRNLRENPIGLLPVVLLSLVTLAVMLVVAFDLTMVTNMARSITAAIAALKGGAERLEAGDLAHRIPVEGEDDLWDVADGFNQAVAGLERARGREKERTRMESELDLARRIQSRLLPSEPPRVTGFEIAGLYDPARQVGGDYYDHLHAGEGRVLLVIADVSGKGVPASLLMSGFRASLMSQDLSTGDPVALAAHLNDFLVRSVEVGKFVTAFLGFADAKSGTLDFVNAGHNPPMMRRVDGSHEFLTEGGTMFGIFPDTPFRAGRVRFVPGDLLVLYTDGVTEGAAPDGELWGDDRLVETVSVEHALSSLELARCIARRVREFEGEGRADDVTLLVARRHDLTP